MTAKTVIRTHHATLDVENEVTHYLIDDGSEPAALGYIQEIEQAYIQIGQHPSIGSLRYAYELDVPGLRSWPLHRYLHLVFYIERADHVEIWRVLNEKCDIPAWLGGDGYAWIPLRKRESYAGGLVTGISRA
jgi:toxin ParE1/3/4